MSLTNSQVNMGLAYNDFNDNLTSSESAITGAISQLTLNTTDQPTQSQLLLLQYKMQVFAFFAEFTSTMEKKIGETFQGVVRNF